MEVVTLADLDETLFQGSCADVQREILGALGLSGRTKFPIRRMATLWKNKQWRAMITRWCETEIGRATFSISLWVDMAKCRIDEVCSANANEGYLT
jgi:hypothetical protein